MEKLVKCPQIQSSSDMVSEVGSCRTEVVTYSAIKKIHDHQIHLWYPLLELPRPEAANRAYFARIEDDQSMTTLKYCHFQLHVNSTSDVGTCLPKPHSEGHQLPYDLEV